MKLSSAFDPVLMMNGCTGKTSRVMDEVAAITEDRMSYMDKSSGMKGIENRQDVSDVVWSGIFNLSDEHGVNTIAYGSSGTIYGCYNYDNLNVASYSKSYSGNDIIDAAYAVGESVKADGDVGDASSVSGGDNSYGIMIGISKDHVYIYTESRNAEGSVAKTWSLASFNSDGGSGLNEDSLEIYHIFSAGRMFFLATNQGLIAFNASDVNLASFRIDLWDIISSFPPLSMLNCNEENEASIAAAKDSAIREIQFIRQKEFEFADRTGKVSAYAVSWNTGNLSSAAFIQQIDNQWKVVPILSSKSCIVSDIMPMSQMSFPSDVKTSIPSAYPATPDGETIRWIGREAVSILPPRVVESSNEYSIIESLNGETSTALRMKTQNGYTILATNALITENELVDNRPLEAIDDSTIPNLYSYLASTRRWNYEKPWIILNSSDPLPKHLENNGLYWVAKSLDNGEFYSRWIENYEVEKNSDASSIDPSSIVIEKNQNFILPENATQVFNDSSEPIKISFDAKELLKDKIVINKFTAIERYPSSASGIQFKDIVRSTNARNYYCVWNQSQEKWNITRTYQSGYALVDSIIDYGEILSNSVERVYGCIAPANDVTPFTVYIGTNEIFVGSSSFFDESGILSFNFRVNPNSTLDFFDNEIHFRVGFNVIDKPEINFTNIPALSFGDENPFKIALLYSGETETIQDTDDRAYAILYLNALGTLPVSLKLFDTNELDESDISFPSTFDFGSIAKIKVSEIPRYPTNLQIQTSNTQAWTVVNRNGNLEENEPYLITDLHYDNFRNSIANPNEYICDVSENPTQTSTKNISRRFIYSSTAILSELQDGTIVGNKITCNLIFANAVDNYAFSISNLDNNKLNYLIPSSDYQGDILECIHSYTANENNISKAYPAGLVKLIKNENNTILTFAKEWNNAQGTSIPWDGVNYFTPKINNGSNNFIVNIPCTKTFVAYSQDNDQLVNINKTVNLVLEIPKAIVADKEDWTGEYREYFQDCDRLQSSSWHYISFDSNCLAFSTEEAFSGQALPKCKQIEISSDAEGLKFEFNEHYGCKIPFDSNASAISYEIASSITENMSSYILGSTRIWSAKASSSENHALAINHSTPCLNFTDGRTEYHQYAALTETTGILRTFSLEMSDEEIWLSIHAQNVGQMQNEWNNNSFVSVPVNENTPIFASVNGSFKMFFMRESADSGNETGTVRHSLREVSNSDINISSHTEDVVDLASIFSSNLEKYIVRIHNSQDLVSIPNAASLCAVKYDSEERNEVLYETGNAIETLYLYDLDDIDTTHRIAIRRNNSIDIFNLKFVLNGNKLFPEIRTLESAYNYGNIENAIKNDLMAGNGTNWKKLTLEDDETCRFSNPVSKGNIPYIQYSTLKQIPQYDSTNPKKIVHWNTTFDSAGSFTLYIQTASNTEMWSERPASTYDSSKSYSILSNSYWPEFWPVVGDVFNITEAHLSGSGSRYSAGQYIYVGDGSRLEDCYAKLPYLDSNVHSSGISWTLWMNNQKQTFFMVLGTENGKSFGRTTKVSAGADGSLNIDSTFDSNFENWPIQSLRLNASEMLPHSNSIFSAIVDSTSSKQKVYAAITLGSFKIAIPEMGDFLVPRIAGLFVNEQSNIFGITEAIADIDVSEIYEVNSIMEKLQLSSETSILGLTTRINPSSRTAIYPTWTWEASLVPYTVQTDQYGRVFVVGMSGLTVAIKSGQELNAQTSKKYLYAKSISKGSITNVGGRAEDSTLPRIYPPYNDESIEEAEIEYVVYDEHGFYVKSSGSSSGTSSSEDSAPRDMSGTDAMASMSKIIAMTTFKAYNAPIVVGLYEKGGLILYYGTRCFDKSILGTKRFVYGHAASENSDTLSPEDIEDSFASYINQRMLDTYANKVNVDKKNRILLTYLKGTDNISRAIELYAPNFAGNARLIEILNDKVSGIPIEEDSLSLEEKDAIIKIEQSIIKEEERSLAESEADEKFIKAYEYSVNNSTESQWINIPIYVQQGNDYVEVDETFATLTSSMAGGRIRLSVGTTSGNVYWRDLNPLHADKYISYIPTGMLSQKEQEEIAIIEEDEGNASLKEFLFGSNSDSNVKPQTVKIGWTDWAWIYNGSEPVSGSIEYIARHSSKCVSDNGNDKWLIANGKDIGMKLTDNEADMVQNSAVYAPYVRKRSWRWILGGKLTSISVYANEPEVKMINGRPVWHLNGTSTGIAAISGVYPRIVLNNNVPSWIIGDNASDIIGPVIENGHPYVKDRTWMIQEYGKSSPTKIFSLDSKADIVETIEKEKYIDLWGINGKSIPGFSTTSELTPITKFSTAYRPCWKFENVLDSNGSLNANLSTPYSSKSGSCPFILEPQTIGIIDTINEEPLWKSTSFNAFNEQCVECDMFFVEPIGSSNEAYVRTVENSESLKVSGVLPSGESEHNLKFYIGMSGKEWWLLPVPDGPNSSRIGPYTSDATPQSIIGTRWTCTRMSYNTTKEWDSFEAPQNSVAEERFVEETNESTNENELVKYWFINGINTGLKSGHYTKPRLKCSIWKWTLNSNLTPVIQESGICPYQKRPEYCMWFNGQSCGKIQNAGKLQLYMDQSTNAMHWFVDGMDTGIPYDEECSSKVTVIPPENSNERWKFEWRVQDSISKDYILVSTTNSCFSPITQETAMSWWIKDKSGNPVDTGISAMDPLSGKGLESDGIASRLVSETFWNDKKKMYETIGPDKMSWTPLASLFVDAYEEVSYGVLESIKEPWSTSNPNIMKKGMAWEMISSNDLFGVSDVCIVDAKSTSWDAYKEEENANLSCPAFDVYIGWKKNNDRNDLYDSYCAIRSIETGAVTKWTIAAKDWKFEHLELVTKSDGKLNNIVILASKGWIASTNSISYANGGKDIKAIVWNSPVNPVSEVLNELEKIISFKWNSWDSNENSEFAAVGSYGVYVYSPDCIKFIASVPYGENAELLEIVWNPEKSEFKMWGVDVALDDDAYNGGSTTISKGDGLQEDSEEDFESAYEKNAVNASQGKSVSINSLSEQTIYKHNHKRMDGIKETLYYQFSKATTSFEEIFNVTDQQDENAIFIVADLPYKFSSGSKSWTYVYSKCKPSTKEVLGAGYLANQVSWAWMWSRQEETVEAKKMSYITVSENTKSVAYGFPDLKRFIRSYKNLYTNSLEFVGAVCQFATSEKDSTNVDGKSLKEAYEELVKVDGLKIYSDKLDTAWGIYKRAKKLRDNSHYAENDCYNTYLQKIGQSLALEHQDYFNKAKQAMWTAQAFKNYYSGLVARGSGTTIQKESDAVGGSSYAMKE